MKHRKLILDYQGRKSENCRVDPDAGAIWVVNGASLPRVCTACGSPESLTYRNYRVARNSIDIGYYLCPIHDQRRKVGTFVFVVLLLAGVASVVVVLLAVAGLKMDPRVGFAALAASGLLGFCMFALGNSIRPLKMLRRDGDERCIAAAWLKIG